MATAIEKSPATEEASPYEHQERNMIVLALYQVVLRVGWIFKTESIVIPAFLDLIVPNPALRGMLRGFLPMLNRLGHSIPPVLFSRRLKLARHKKWVLAVGTLAMSLPFFLLAAMWLWKGAVGNQWFSWIFLLTYGLFFIFTGVVHLTTSTLQGKLIRPTRHGRLMVLYTVVGVPLAILAAWLLLGRWLALGEAGFTWIFGFVGAAFCVAAVVVLALREPADNYHEPGRGPGHHFTAAWEVLRTNRNFRRLAWVAATFSTVLMLFPHYQALGRTRLGLSLDNLMLWVIVQNAGTGLFSVVAGAMSDSRGNRLVLRAAILACASTPLLAAFLAVLAGSHPAVSRSLFPLVFVPIGLTPVSLRIMNNYTLEICEPADHPRYVSTLSLCVAVPIVLFAPLLGLLITATSFEFVFLAAAAIIILSGLLTLRIAEPRHGPPGGATVVAADEHPVD